MSPNPILPALRVNVRVRRNWTTLLYNRNYALIRNSLYNMFYSGTKYSCVQHIDDKSKACNINVCAI